jgi:hypothetical protein
VLAHHARSRRVVGEDVDEHRLAGGRMRRHEALLRTSFTTMETVAIFDAPKASDAEREAVAADVAAAAV